MATQSGSQLSPAPRGCNMVVTERWSIDSADPIVSEHIVNGRIIAPFAFWLSRCLDAVTALQASPPCEFHHVLVRKPVALDAGSSVDVEFSGTRENDAGRFEVRLRSPSDKSSDDLLVEGSWRDALTGESELPRPAAGTAWDRNSFYQVAAASGLAYGPLLQRIAKMHAGNGTWSAELSPPAEGCQAYSDRIASWDALLQCGSVLAANGGSNCWIPFRIDQIRFRDSHSGAPTGTLAGEWVHGAVPHAEERVANLFGFLQGSNAVAVEFLGVHYRFLKQPPNGSAAPQKSAPTAPAAQVSAPGLENILDRLAAAGPALRRQMIVSFIGDQVLQVLQWDASRRCELQRGFVTVGLDSLMAVDLQFRLQAAFKFALPIGDNIELKSIDSLADFMLRKYEEIV